VTFFVDAGLVEKGGFVFVFRKTFYFDKLFRVVWVMRAMFTDSLFNLNVTVVRVRVMRVRAVAVTVAERSYDAVGMVVMTVRLGRARGIGFVVDVGLVLLFDMDLYVLRAVVMVMPVEMRKMVMTAGSIVREFGFRDTFFRDNSVTVTFPLVLVGEMRGRLVMAAELARRGLELRFDFFVDGPR